MYIVMIPYCLDGQAYVQSFVWQSSVLAGARAGARELAEYMDRAGWVVGDPVIIGGEGAQASGSVLATFSEAIDDWAPEPDEEPYEPPDDEPYDDRLPEPDVSW